MTKRVGWINGEPFTVTEEQTKLRWGSGFNCKLCGENFHTGTVARWIYANGTPGAGTGNFFVCANCDGPNDLIITKAKESLRLAIALATRWNIYGPDWERERQRADAKEMRYS